jgi:hypothetical protein
MRSVWQKVCGARHYCHWWQESEGGKVTAMETFIAATVLLLIISGVVVLLERNNRRTAGLPRAPFGADLEGDFDLHRVQHDLDVARRSRMAGRRAAGQHLRRPHAA